jgi:hypothetical protein
MLCAFITKLNQMSEKLELSNWDAQKRLLLFLKLRKGKSISEKTISDFSELLNRMWHNFKDFDENTISKNREKNNEMKFLALKAIKCGFINFETGGNYRLTDIDSFSLYQDDKYKVKIKGELKEITTKDFVILEYIFFGETR